MQEHDTKETIRELIDRAAREVGTKAELARMLGVPATRLNEWRGGHRPCPAEMVAIIADIAGMPAEEWLIRATLWYAKEKPYYARLWKAVGKALPRTGAATAGFFATVGLGLFGELARMLGKVPQFILC
ncbi:hypothetical protein Talka_00384 [Tepidimonas alkaliphilus]|uniref:Uncharacterized protein n=1 Tax=Tepidimonas alkaliphilus TaxID=2588942 RepID=A0A554WDR2_9BURK|nr:helix-turn-helix domain-containing protein [Tepidimonas alkaliphilus]TSE21704.1 hypothetical protein Talka_00384 [Tepidimonas alkaliphilus]